MPQEIDLDGLLRFARDLLADPAGCWKSLAPEQRPGFQQAVYPNGLRFDGEAFGTAESSWAFGYLQQEMSTKNGVASPTGIEPA